MTSGGVTLDVCRDGVLVPVGEVKWIAKNVFTVSVDLYRRVISCELSAIDLPRGTAPALEGAVLFALECVRAAPHRFLRQDHYATFPLQGYGDILYAADAAGTVWHSLQEALLCLGVARLVRPPVCRLDALLAAEADGAQGAPRCAWGRRLAQFERGPQMRAVWTGRVVEVLRGDVYAVRWDGAVGCLPPLLLLDAVVCHGRRTDAGDAAWRWARRLLRRRVEARVRSVAPSDHAVANNTQLFRHEQLAGVRAALRVVEGGAAWDVGAALVAAGHAFVRPSPDPAIPRADGFEALLCAARNRVVPSDPIAHHACHTRTGEDGDPQRGGGFAVDGHLLSPAGCDALVAFAGPATPSLASFWRAVLWVGDVESDPYDNPPRTHVARPMRALWPLEEAVRQAMEWEGTIASLALVTESRRRERKSRRPQPRRRFLRVEVEAVVAEADLRRARERMASTALGVIMMHPADGAVLGSSATVTVVYDRQAGIRSTEMTAYVSVMVAEYEPKSYDPKQHRPAPCSDVVRAADGDPLVSITKTISLRSECREALFVVDVMVDFGNCSEQLRRRGTFLLSTAAQIGDDSDASEAAGERGDARGESPNSSDNDAADEKGVGMPLEADAEVLAAQRGAGGEETTSATTAAAAPSAWLATAVSKAYTPPSFFHAATDFYMEVNPIVSLETLREWAADLLALDVRCAPLGIADINGYKGFIGDVVLADSGRSLLGELFERKWMPQEELNEEDHASHRRFSWAWVPKLMRRRWRRLHDALCADEANQRVTLLQRSNTALRRLCAEWLECSQCLAGAMSIAPAVEAFVAGERNAPEDSVSPHFDDTNKKSIDNLAVADDTNNEKNDDVEDCVVISIGTLTTWRPIDDDRLKEKDVRGDIISKETGDKCEIKAHAMSGDGGNHEDNSDDDDDDDGSLPVLSSKILPPHIPLFAASMFPRQLFHTHYRHHRSIAAPLSNPSAGKTCHVDAAFMRLPRRPLANLFLSNFERLPVSMRNGERAFCDFLLRDGEEDVLYAAEPNMAALMSMLLMLQPRRVRSERHHVHSNVYELLREAAYDIEATAVSREAVLYRICGADGGSAPRLFFGKPDTLRADAFEVSHCDFPPNLRAVRHAIGILGVESLLAPTKANSSGCNKSVHGGVVPLVERASEECYPLGARGIDSVPLTGTTPRLYRPLPWLRLLGDPLVIRDEHDADTLGRSGSDEKEETCKKEDIRLARRYIAVNYRAVMLKDKKVYHPFSYGRVRRRFIHRQIEARAQRGGEIVDYFSLLLRQTSTGAFADGVLRFYGSAHEPLHLFYQSRRQLRFRLGALWPGLLGDSLKADLEAENNLLNEMACVVRRIIDSITEKSNFYDRTTPSRLYLMMRLDVSASVCTQNTLRISIYPIADEASMQGEKDSGDFNPHQIFEKTGNVYGRLEQHALLVRYCPDEGKYDLAWDELLEQESPSRTSPSETDNDRS